MSKRVAIQGIKGSYHHQAAKMFFGEDVDLVECVNFKEIPNHINSGNAEFGVMAIENSIAGSLLQNYKLLGLLGQSIVGEIYIPIEHSLLVVGDQKIEDILEVHSHPMAILQCENFFDQYPHIKLVESDDTANSAKEISESRKKGIGAIAGKIAGDIYGLDTIADNIQTIKNNYTRFFIITKEEVSGSANDNISKASLKMTLSHESGSLSKVLALFSIHGLSLTKIQSVPIIDKPWKYSFFVDVVFPRYETFQSVLGILEHETEKVELLGTYREWKLEYITNID